MAQQVAKLDTRELDRLIKQAPEKTAAIIARAAMQVKAEAQAVIREKDIIDTSALHNSIEAVPKGTHLWIVQDGVEYGIFIELGHLTRAFTKSYGAQNFVAARPFMVPAVEKVRPQFEKELGEIAK